MLPAYSAESLPAGCDNVLQLCAPAICCSKIHAASAAVRCVLGFLVLEFLRHALAMWQVVQNGTAGPSEIDQWQGSRV